MNATGTIHAIKTTSDLCDAHDLAYTLLIEFPFRLIAINIGNNRQQKYQSF